MAVVPVVPPGWCRMISLDRMALYVLWTRLSGMSEPNARTAFTEMGERERAEVYAVAVREMTPTKKVA